MIWVGAVGLAAGVLVWTSTVMGFVAEGYGFDMTSASAFDAKWAKGALLVAVGVGVMKGSWVLGAATFPVAFFSTMLVKPPVQRAVERRRARAIERYRSEDTDP